MASFNLINSESDFEFDLFINSGLVGLSTVGLSSPTNDRLACSHDRPPIVAEAQSFCSTRSFPSDSEHRRFFPSIDSFSIFILQTLESPIVHGIGCCLCVWTIFATSLIEESKEHHRHFATELLCDCLRNADYVLAVHYERNYGANPNQFDLDQASLPGHFDTADQNDPLSTTPGKERANTLELNAQPHASYPVEQSAIVDAEPLIIWYNEHKDNPYPNKEDMARLAEASRKTLKSTRTWFANERRRRDRRRNSRRSGNSWTPPDSTHAGLQKSSSLVCNATVTGMKEVNSVDSLGHTPRRKGKRRSTLVVQPSPSSSDATALHHVNKPYFCTYLCGKAFRERYDWRKHEATHLPEMWHCMPDDSPVLYDYCAFCGLFDPRVSHFRLHYNIEACRTSPAATRSFARKDKLRDHINRVHIRCADKKGDRSKLWNSSGPDLLDGWFREPPDLATNHPASLWCGFCQTTFLSWTERMDHVGEQLQRRETRLSWKPFNA